jgi:hypothetical protein
MESGLDVPYNGHRTVLLVLLPALVVTLSLLAILAFYSRQPAPLPASIRKQLSFVAFAPVMPWSVPPKSVSYGPRAKLLTFNAQNGQNSLVVTEQPVSSQSKTTPTVLTKLHEYDSFATANGTVYLAKPADPQGQTEAVLQAQGTLLLGRPSHSLSLEQWRQLFNALEVIK